MIIARSSDTPATVKTAIKKFPEPIVVRALVAVANKIQRNPLHLCVGDQGVLFFLPQVPGGPQGQHLVFTGKRLEKG